MEFKKCRLVMCVMLKGDGGGGGGGGVGTALVAMERRMRQRKRIGRAFRTHCAIGTTCVLDIFGRVGCCWINLASQFCGRSTMMIAVRGD